MRNDTKTRAGIAALVYTMINAVLSGICLVTVLMVPYFRANAESGILVAVLASLLLAVPAAWLLAPYLRARYRRQPQVLHSYARHKS